MIQIKSIPVGFPAKQANVIEIRVMPFQTDATSCNTYYELANISEQKNESDEIVEVRENLAYGYVPISEEKYALWADDNTYIEDIVLKELGLERL